ncbi:MAG: GNAT family N-acetyltransferase [Thermoanaerobaculia bacterium]|nr:MAG: GNAT family N-acetyltransferase [Thermoanaerobaculia bacterium]
MARYVPHPEKRLLWCVIQAEGNDAGTVWLESAEPRAVVLGILLGGPAVFGQGIGTRAIQLALERACQMTALLVARLNVRAKNKRVISCYERCGFRVVASGTRERLGIRYDFFTMEKSLQSGESSAAPSQL